MKFALISGAVLAGTLIAAPVLAHPKLVASNPGANAAVPRPAKIQLRFSERLFPKLSGANLIMTGMPGMKDHPPMPMKGAAAVGPDGKTLILTPASPLPAGSYRLNWHVVSSDTHRVTGGYNFTVR